MTATKNANHAMPQPAAHLVIADRALQRWRAAGSCPFDATSPAAVNAFLMGAEAPDMGLFPGGTAAFSSCTHLHRTGELTRSLLRHARTEVQRAFAWGWLTHVIADAVIHPIVNAHAGGVGDAALAEHVRVEVGIDVMLATRHDALAELRLRAPLTRHDIGFVAAAMHEVCDWRPTTRELLRMQRGMLHFTQLVIHFTTRVAPRLCWNEPMAAPPLASTFAWRAISALSSPRTTAYAYMNPYRPSDVLSAKVDAALLRIDRELDSQLADAAATLPDYDLQTGAILSHARRVA